MSARVKDFTNDAWEQMKGQILVKFFELYHARVNWMTDVGQFTTRDYHKGVCQRNP